MQVGSIHLGVMYSMHLESEVHIFGLHVCVLISMSHFFSHRITLNISPPPTPRRGRGILSYWGSCEGWGHLHCSCIL